MNAKTTKRRLFLVLGDQLNRDDLEQAGLDPVGDLVWMAEAQDESSVVWSHKARIVLFLSAMRHFHHELVENGYEVLYHRLDDNPHRTLSETLAADLQRLAIDEVVVLEAGEYRVEKALRQTCAQAGLSLRVLPDGHFISDASAFRAWSSGRKRLRLEHFYRHLRKQQGILMADGEPAGGKWNYDSENRQRFGRAGPGVIPEPAGFAPDAITRDVIQLVDKRFPDHPGKLDNFAWPVTRDQALLALTRFVEQRLPAFGAHQDAMWAGEPFLHHSLLSSALNLKLIGPRETVAMAERAFEDHHAPLNSVEGFIRQVLGWREFVRGIYRVRMPDYLHMNALDARAPLPGFYWSGQTDMACLAAVIDQTLEYGYSHHIQRLMVTGLFALLFGVEPKQVHEWFLAMYVDAVEWVELPNTLGMSQYADGGILASKPYAASGRYIQRMSNYCKGCRFRPDKRLGEEACPFTTLYWDFLLKHQSRFAKQPRTANQWRHLEKMGRDEKTSIANQAEKLRARPG
jgi:deoxyribodipyrimidine photolyase-related protein